MDRKSEKKFTRCVAVLKRNDPSVATSQEPTECLYVGNGGILCGLTEDTLHTTFIQFGSISSIRVLQHRPYSFVTFDSVASASKAVDQLNCQHPSTFPGNVVCYLAYVEPASIPRDVSSLDHGKPNDLKLLAEFVSLAEENALISFVDGLSTQGTDANDRIAVLKHRRVHHFGYRFVYGSNDVDLENAAPPIPKLFSDIVNRIMDTKLVKSRPNQITVNVYEPGQGIPLHTDTHSAFEEAIISLSLGSDVMFDFRYPDKTGLCGSENSASDHGVCPIELPTRSLLVMLGESRYVWKHGITPRVYDTRADGTVRHRARRISLTFRAIRKLPCECDYPKYCDNPTRKETVALQTAQVHAPMSSKEAAELEASYVADVYENIADHFDVTRYSLWPGVVKFLDSLNSGDLVLDVGCGNGKYLRRHDDLIKVGCDRSANLCSICASKGCSVFVSNCLSIPVAAGRFDAAISIAVIHHMATKERRQQAIRELLNVIRSGGRVLIYVWAFEQEWKRNRSAYLKSGKTDTGAQGVSGGRVDAVSEATSSLIVDDGTSPRCGKEGTTTPEVSGCGKCLSGIQDDSHVEQCSSERTCVDTDLCHNTRGGSVLEKPREISTDTNQAVKNAPFLRVHKNRTNFVEQDLLVPWTKQAKGKKATADGDNQSDTDETANDFLRFYHVFKEGELEGDCLATGMCTVDESYHEQGNWCVVLKRI